MIDEEILVRYISGLSTETEDALVASWLSKSNENQERLEQFYFAWKAAGCLNIIETVDSKKKLSALKSKVKPKLKNKKIKIAMLWMQRVAAVLFIPVLLLSYYFYMNKASDQILQYMEIRTNPGMITSVILPDSSKVWINSCGYLKYPVRFTDKNREVYLEGEGYFEVKKNDEAPFSVKVNDNYSVEVLGTTFNVTAYSEDKTIETTLVDGSVRLNITTENGGRITQTLTPSQKGIFANNVLSLSQVDPLYETSWKDGKMYFKNESMEGVLKRLSRHYNVIFDVKKPEVLESFITAKFETEQLLQVLEYLKLASNIQYKIRKPDINDDKLNETTIELTK